jgi:hypothetical protein
MFGVIVGQAEGQMSFAESVFCVMGCSTYGYLKWKRIAFVVVYNDPMYCLTKEALIIPFVMR